MQEYTDIDLSLIGSATSMIINWQQPSYGGGAISSSVSNAGKTISNFLNTVNFQFPPRITGDNKRAEWKEIPVASYEPLAFWMGADARKITMQFEYIVTSRSGSWTITAINGELLKLKSYFYNTVVDGLRQYPLVKLSLYDYSPKPESNTERLGTWRMFDIDIKPDGPILLDGSHSFHLKHTVTTNLALVTANNSPSKPQQKIEEKEFMNFFANNKKAISKWF